MDKKKERFIVPKMSLVEFIKEDVIVTSLNGNSVSPDIGGGGPGEETFPGGGNL